MVDTHRHLYNRALQERRDAWEQEQRSVRYGDQSAQLKIDRTTDLHLAATNFSSCQATLRRLNKTFQAFFCRVRRGEKAGYPRFKGRNRFDSFGFKEYGNGLRSTGGACSFLELAESPYVGIVRCKGSSRHTGLLRKPADGMPVSVCNMIRNRFHLPNAT